jgi:hypothetical protein
VLVLGYYDVRMRAARPPEFTEFVVTSRSLTRNNQNGIRFGTIVTDLYTDNNAASHQPTHAPAFTGVRVVDGDARAPPFPNAHCQTTARRTLLYPNDHATLAHIAASTAARLLYAEVRLDVTIRLPYGAGGRTRSFAAKHA